MSREKLNIGANFEVHLSVVPPKSGKTLQTSPTSFVGQILGLFKAFQRSCRQSLMAYFSTYVAKYLCISSNQPEANDVENVRNFSAIIHTRAFIYRKGF